MRTGVGLCDTSPMGKLLVQGDDVAGFLGASLSATDIPLPGSVSWHSESTLLCRLASDQLLVLTTPETAGQTRTALDAQHDEYVHLVDMTSALTGLCVAGPCSADVLMKVTDSELAGPTASDHDLRPSQPFRSAGHTRPGRFPGRALLPHLRIARLGGVRLGCVDRGWFA